MADMCYYGNVMTTTRWWLCVTILHLQQYSHRLNYFFLRDLSGGCRISMTLLPQSRLSCDHPSDKSVLQIKAMECRKVVVSGKGHENLINSYLKLKSVILKENLAFF